MNYGNDYGDFVKKKVYCLRFIGTLASTVCCFQSSNCSGIKQLHDVVIHPVA